MLYWHGQQESHCYNQQQPLCVQIQQISHSPFLIPQKCPNPILLTNTKFKFDLCVFNRQHCSFEKNGKKTKFLCSHEWLKKQQILTVIVMYIKALRHCYRPTLLHLFPNNHGVHISVHILGNFGETFPILSNFSIPRNFFPTTNLLQGGNHKEGEGECNPPRPP